MTTALPPVESQRKLADRVVTSLRDAIMAGRLSPGTPLGMAALAENLGVSTTPVREALYRLRDEGLITGTAHRTFRVADLCLEDIRDLHRLHAFVSGELAVRAAPRLSPDHIRELEELDRQIRDSADIGDYQETHRLNFSFHRRVNLSAPPSILHHFVLLTTRYVSVRSYPELSGWLDVGASEHTSMIEVLKGGDPAAIRASTIAHIMTSGERLLAELRARGGWAEGKS